MASFNVETNKLNTNTGVTAIRHPEYYEMETEWEKFRFTYGGGRPFIDEYLQTFSKRETTAEFRARKKASYCPAHAKTAVNEIKDAISERLVDVTRIAGPVSYQKATNGLNGGVDHLGSTMNGFISCEVLPELLSMGKVGVYIDRETLPMNPSRADVAARPPYLYLYRTEDILAWNYNDVNELTSLLLREEVYNRDVATGLPKGTKERYRLLIKDEGIITVKFYDNKGVELPEEKKTLSLQSIPFALFKIAQSLLTDIADYQIALLNLGSSDLSYAIKANFPFYVEQYDPREFLTNLLPAGDINDADGNLISAGTSTEANTAKDKEALVGTASGRRYPKGTEQPNFIHPSSEPLVASMTKQKDLQAEIRELTRLSVKSLASSSEGSKEQDNRSVESGLASIGAELEKGERQIADVWAMYEQATSAIIKYPKNYTLQTNAERRAEVEKLLELMPKLPSDLLKKQVAKQIAYILISHRVSQDEMEAINKQIDAAEVIVIDPEEIRADVESGLLGNELASKLRGYPKDEVAKATADHLARIIRIAQAQSSVGVDKSTDRGNSIDMLDGANGVKDADTETDTAKKEKEVSRDTTLEDKVSDKTRGAAK